MTLEENVTLEGPLCDSSLGGETAAKMDDSMNEEEEDVPKTLTPQQKRAIVAGILDALLRECPNVSPTPMGP